MSKKRNSKKTAMSEKGIKELQNSATTLFANIKYSAVDDEPTMISITSVSPDEGKTTTAVALAMAIATSGNNVLLVEADMRRRSLAKVLRATPSGGIYSLLMGGTTLNDVIWHTPTPQLFFLDVEPNIPSPPDIISSKRFAALVDSLNKSFDYVIFDTPPVGVFVDAAILGTLVDTTILVMRDGYTKRDDAKAALKQMQQVNAPVLGTVLTFSDEQQSDYYYAYYTKEEDASGNLSWKRTK